MFTVDDTDQHKNVVSVKCSWAVAVYPCLDSGVDPADWNRVCDKPSKRPLAKPWPRTEKEVLDCYREDPFLGGGLSTCGDGNGFDCGLGRRCNAVEHAKYRCPSLMRSGGYPCWYVEGKREVRTEASAGFPFGWLAAALGISSLACLCCGLCCWSMMSMDDMVESCKVRTLTLCGSVVCG